MKSEFIQIRVSAKEKRRLVEQAERAGLDLSKFLLRSLTDSSAVKFLGIIDELKGSVRVQTQLAELNDLISSLTGEQIAALPPPDFGNLDETYRNYIAALIEFGALRASATPPRWTREVTPLSSPFFGSELIALRPYLLRVSPAPFKARNIFIDSSLGSRV